MDDRKYSPIASLIGTVNYVFNYPLHFSDHLQNLFSGLDQGSTPPNREVMLPAYINRVQIRLDSRRDRLEERAALRREPKISKDITETREF